MQIGVKKPKFPEETVGITASSSTTSDDVQIDNVIERNSMPLPRKSALDQYETEETRKLPTKELQRLVLLHQLKTAKLQQDYYSKKIQTMESKQFNVNKNTYDKQTNIAVEGDKCYTVLY